jgi:hypothetical protein
MGGLAAAGRRPVVAGPRPSKPWPQDEQNSKRTLASLKILLLVANLAITSLWAITRETHAQSLSILPTDFERLIMPCYLGGGTFNAPTTNGAAGPSYYGPRPGAATGQYRPDGGAYGYTPGGGSVPASPNDRSSNYAGPPGGGGYQSAYAGDQANGRGSPAGSSSYLGSSAAGQSPASLSSSLTGPGPTSGQPRDSLTSNLGQSVPRANTMENFIALVSKLEAANPRLANNPDQLIRTLLARFRLDNYYYDVRTRSHISDPPDRRATDILPALMNGPVSGGRVDPLRDAGPLYGAGGLVDQHLDHDEKCSMYFMLSHFIDKSAAPTNPALGSMPLNQLAGAQNGQKPPSLQAAGTGYSAGVSANLAYSGGASGQRYPGPAPSFGSPITSQMNAFGTGISNTNPEMVGQRSQYGVSSPQLTGSQYNSALASSQLRNSNSAYSGAAAARPAPYIDNSQLASRQFQQQRADAERQATEYGVVTIANQENSALVLNRVLLGLLAATTPPQTIRQLAPVIYPTQDLTSTPKLEEEIDPLFAVTLADLWAISSIPKPGKPAILGDSGHWNDLMCPTSFALERSHSIRFTTAELLGGLDGLNLGMLRRRLINMRRQLRLSELLRIYYSKNGFKPNYPDFGVCQRSSIINTQQDDLRRQAENYLRLYQLSLPTSDQEIALQVARLDGFRDFVHRAASVQPEICQQESNAMDFYPMDPQDNCELSRADIVTVLDGSPQANKPFMQIVTLKLAQRVGLSRESNSLSILTNQQDSSGYGGGGGGYSLNAIVRNSTNLGEIGCALVHDTSSSYQGGQVTDPTKLMEMFERALVSLDSEYLTRQGATPAGSSSSYNGRQSSYVSTWLNYQSSDYGGAGYSSSSSSGGPRNTGGAKIILWFNYGSQTKPSRPTSGATNWNPGFMQTTNYGEQQEYRFYEAKKYLRENFRGASILALSPSREDVKAFVYDEDRDIITDVASANDGMSSLAGGTDPYMSQMLTGSSSTGSSQAVSSIDPATYAALSGQADQLVSKLMRRMCTVPAIFQYPMCFRGPSENAISVGYISPGRRQYWMMSPKTFFASRSVRIVFKVDGGRLKVCFGRKPNPDETALKHSQQSGYQQQQQQQSITFQQQPTSGSQSTTVAPQPTSNDYYTGLDYGVCKDVGQNQEIDFLVSDPCYKKSIAECEPFYFVIRELSQPGEGDPNYMCRDEGCKRIDQAKFIMAHTGVTCNSAFKGTQANWFLIMISTLAASIFSLQTTTGTSSNGSRRRSIFRSSYSYICATLFVAYLAVLQQVANAQQQAGVYDFGLGRYGEKRGNYTPSEMLAIVLIVMLILAGLALTIGLCFYVTKRANNRGMQPVKQADY